MRSGGSPFLVTRASPAAAPVAGFPHAAPLLPPADPARAGGILRGGGAALPPAASWTAAAGAEDSGQQRAVECRSADRGRSVGNRAAGAAARRRVCGMAATLQQFLAR